MPDVVNETVIKNCAKHGESSHSVSKRGYEKCRKCAVDAVTKRRRVLKVKAINYKGGKCESCGYSKCAAAMDFHHIIPGEKDFSIASSGNTRSWSEIKEELDKCMLLCANCHREIHAEIIKAPYEELKLIKEKEKTYCPICNSEKNNKLSTCSVSCSRIRSRKVERPPYEELILEIKKTSFLAAGRKYGVSDSSVRKWIKFYEKNLEITNKVRE